MPAKSAQQIQARQSQRDAAMERLRGRKPAERRIFLIMDDDVSEAYEKARGENFVAQAGSDEVTKRAATVEFHFRATGRDAYEALVREHPPTQQDGEDLKRYKEVQRNLGIDTSI